MATIKIKEKDIIGGLVELPEGYEFKKVKTKAERIAEIDIEITNLQNEPEPIDKELLEWAKSNHPYYEDQNRIYQLLAEKDLLNGNG